ncbi:hypothetical protein BO78DRAFT_401221 [Aspergillus sclerotiicarbonarius CBS 121057]|uniref:Transcription factor domain-containing protein n=1 Tax=Aspergillus sclerotiicarbonarius (strain CBS 121057 / IBT 28362) TaxID=1448318 RepID=A0A319DV71_ASPSB|nr:hypothetical protein BO78DRAFT_401221 [Aspergillus sclerotiicarbonarius CBS 121057]
MVTQSLGEPLINPNSHREYVDISVETEPRALQHLLAALPAPGDVQILLRASARSSWYTELSNMQPRSKLTQETLAAVPPSLVEWPGPNPHPVLLAKQMLLFAITLQSPCGDEVLDLSESPSVLMRRLTTAATTWVTTRDEMQGTAEALICIILEGIFETNAGNLRRAWAVYRRALTAAQLMGLHWSPKPALPRTEPSLEADPDFLWFRIVYMDYYLSLLLGLPPGTSDQAIGDSTILRHEPPLGQFERQLTVLASRILERNQTTLAATSKIVTTQSIDAELLTVSQAMPASFWRPPNFHRLTLGSPETLLETLRLGAQVYYHGLLIHLHLPYMMHGVSDEDNKNNNSSSNNTQHEYSKSTCVNASREIMTRFIAHRSFNPMSSCSRPVDFFALLAAMTLLLAHLDAHHHRGVANNLAHQRLSDRAVLDQALERMDVLSHLNNDDTSRQSATLIRRLLDIEADAAGGNRYTARSVSDQGAGGSSSNDFTTHESKKPGNNELCLQIPYLGVIRISRQGPISREPWLNLHSGAQNSPGDPYPTTQGPPAAQLASADEPSMLQHSNSSPDDINMQLPALATGVNDWVFQGVDMAFFDSLMMRGTSCVNGDG